MTRGFLIWILCAALLPPVPVFAQTSRGIRTQITYSNRQGTAVGGYSGSYALLVGVSKYAKGWPPLDAVPGELDEVGVALQQAGFEVRKVINPDAEQLPKAFDKFIKDYGYDKDNRLLFFFSGHGYTLDKGERGYLVPTDAPDPDADEKGFRQKALDTTDILAWCRKMTAKHAIFLFDSCFSGPIFTTRGRPTEPAHISALTDKPVRLFISAGSAGQEVPSKSVFTPCFIKALRGEADYDKDGFVLGTEMGMFLYNKVTDYSDRTQTPQFGKIKDARLDEGDFVFPLTAPDLVSTTLAKLRFFFTGTNKTDPVELASEHLASILRRQSTDSEGHPLKVVPRKRTSEDGSTDAMEFLRSNGERHGALTVRSVDAADTGWTTSTNGNYLIKSIYSSEDAANWPPGRVPISIRIIRAEPARVLAFLFDSIQPSNGFLLADDSEPFFDWSGRDGDFCKCYVELYGYVEP